MHYQCIGISLMHCPSLIGTNGSLMVPLTPMPPLAAERLGFLVTIDTNGHQWYQWYKKFQFDHWENPESSNGYSSIVESELVIVPVESLRRVSLLKTRFTDIVSRNIRVVVDSTYSSFCSPCNTPLDSTLRQGLRM